MKKRGVTQLTWGRTNQYYNEGVEHVIVSVRGAHDRSGVGVICKIQSSEILSVALSIFKCLHEYCINGLAIRTF